MLNEIRDQERQHPDKINEVYGGNTTTIGMKANKDRVDRIVAEASGSVIDIGCSGGVIAILCAVKGLTVVGVDMLREHLEEANKIKETLPEDTQERLTFILGEAETIPVADNSYDTVILGEILEHVYDPKRVMAEAVRICKPEGKILASVPVGFNMAETHIRWFSRYIFSQFMNAYAQRVKVVEFLGVQMLAICKEVRK